MELTKAEEQLMEYLWQQGKAFLKELIEAFPDPKPANTTVATLIKRMSDKGFVGYQLFGNSRRYYPLVDKNDYYARQVNGMIRNSFNDSAVQFASFFTRSAHLSENDLKELRKLIDSEIKKKKK
ncbi:BlaI/MecI/CopY family transcriptional regulator [Sediminibacterium ginsengisoli]|uniref:Predicted transcriptional regulator n=1 Tax=Sediminibacterium ginsengisoli TaxID=413434 RepID=A0A1T4NMX7_9BACT|nr:BlaI/MecI/CopY family transcriptional regulator [Sediminibacterium ginsengisoli]SJZ80098.1 Predicted transcriptional regulator [Sediminibacterium ginsengisoli]